MFFCILMIAVLALVCLFNICRIINKYYNSANLMFLEEEARLNLITKYSKYPIILTILAWIICSIILIKLAYEGVI